MKIANEFTVSAPIEDAWNVLTDLEQVIPLMPGAQMTGREGDDVLGSIARTASSTERARRRAAPATRPPPSPHNCTKQATTPGSPSTPI